MKFKKVFIIKQDLLRIFFIICAIHIANTHVYSQDAGSRASFTRGGWVGARYVAMGKAAEVVVDDVYSIYWNPAGLVELKGKKTLSPDQIKKKAEKGDIEGITEEDLTRFSDDNAVKSAFQIGASAAMLDIDREAGFIGIAFDFFGGICGAGAYSIQSRDIESRDEAGNFIKKINYNASVGYLSYSWASGVSSTGVTIKGLHEKIGDIEYIGGGFDIGTRIEVIPFLKVGFVIQDIGTGLKPRKKYEDIENDVDFASTSLKLSTAFTSRESDFIFAISGVKKIQQDEYELNIGLQYDVFSFLSLYVGLSNKLFSSGTSFKLFGMDATYAFIYDDINSGFNHIISVTLEL